VLVINRIDRRVGNVEVHDGACVSPEPAERQQEGVLGVATALAHIAVMVVLASLAILVLLPAALAAQAASAI
jgi:hypothetical protein